MSLFARCALHFILSLQAWQLHEDDRHLDLLDEKLDPSEYDTDYVKKVINLALRCTQLPASRRPVMSEVVVLHTGY